MNGDTNGKIEISQLVECPRCGNQFELSETFRDQFEAEKRQEIDDALRENEEKVRAEMEKVSQAKLTESAEQVKVLEAKLKADQKAQQNREKQIRAEMEKASQAKLTESAEEVKALQAQLKADQKEQQKREKQIRAEMEKASQAKLTESAEQVKVLEAKLKADQKAQQNREKQIRAEMEKASQAKLTESAEQVKVLEAKLKADKKEQEKREAKIRSEAEKLTQKNELEREERNIEKKRLERQVEDLQRQLTQGAVELQGEVLEVYLKNQLQTHFPLDKIIDIGRGRAGADLTQEVWDARLSNCGIVVWEAKRTKHWNDKWLVKVKQDADRLGAHLRVIVSQALPIDIRNFGLKEGVWVSSIECALPLALALRSQLIESANLQRAIQGQGIKMDAIYQYLTSPTFSERIQRMVETWTALEDQVASEERAMKRQWKERRKQLDRMKDATIEMYTDFSSIFGREIAQVPGLELGALPPGDNVKIIDP